MYNKNNFILLMGSDGAGKSTIAKVLSKVLKYEVHHFGPVKSYEEGKNQYFNFIENTNTNVICDRFHEGEKIFAPLYRNYEADYFDELEQELMKKFNPLLVLVEPPFAVVLQRLIERGEDFVKPQDFRYAYDRVYEIYEDSKLPKIMVNSYKYSVYENVRQIIAMM